MNEVWEVVKDERTAAVSILTLVGATYVLFRPIVIFASQNQVDYANHLHYLQSNMDASAIQRLLSMFPHLLFHLLTYLYWKIIPSQDKWGAAAGVALGFYILLALVLYWLFAKLLGTPKRYRTALLYILVILALILAMPVNIFTPRNLYLGYIAQNVYHSPTMVVLRPFAVLLFYAAVKGFISPATDRPATDGRRIIWLTILISVLCTLAKPNYVITLIPTVTVAMGFMMLRRRYANWSLLAAAVIPAGFILLVQALLFTNTQGIIFAPLAVLRSWRSINPLAPTVLLPKLLLSILFPLLVFFGYFRQAVRDIYLQLAWIAFGFGAGYFYLLAERGDRLDDGNFAWSAQITLTVWFVVSTIFFIQQMRRQKISLVGILCGTAWGLHLVSGIYWYYIHITAYSMGDIISSRW